MHACSSATAKSKSFTCTMLSRLKESVFKKNVFVLFCFVLQSKMVFLNLNVELSSAIQQ